MNLSTPELKIQQKNIIVKGIRILTGSTYILELERHNMPFRAGQYICLGVEGIKSLREYSVYSGENEANLEVMIKEVDEGLLSRKLKESAVNQRLRMEGPFGTFTIDPQEVATKKFFFIATGTGIAPFHSYTRSYPDIQYKLLHGVRTLEEAYEREHYAHDNYILCTSKDNRGHFEGRVTDYLRQNPPAEIVEYYLCGNGKMVYEAVDILRNQDVPAERIHFEIYF
jgi:ferredoxin/flavodoxin---NADP+ reductase